MNDDARKLIEMAVGMRRKALTLRQRAYREWIDSRNRQLQEKGVKPPKSGIFGQRPKDK